MNKNLEKSRECLMHTCSVLFKRRNKKFYNNSFSLTQVTLEIQCHLKEAETRDITHVDILGRLDYV